MPHQFYLQALLPLSQLPGISTRAEIPRAKVILPQTGGSYAGKEKNRSSGHNLSITFSLWGGPSTGTGYPERLWSLHPWKYSKPRTYSWAAGCGWPCSSRGGDKMNPRAVFHPQPFLWLSEKSSNNPSNKLIAINEIWGWQINAVCKLNSKYISW